MATDPDVQRIAAGYDAVYDAIPNSATFARIWRDHALGPAYPKGFEHISFITLDEMRQMAGALRLEPGDTLADLACGMGGPGLWIARETNAGLAGVDISAVALEHALARAKAHAPAVTAEFRIGTFDATGFDDASVDAIMSVDALQYAPDKRAALAEFARILKPGGRIAFECFEVEPDRVKDLPIWGADPVADYRPLLEGAGFRIERYDVTEGWDARVTATYEALAGERDALTAEMGEAAAAALLAETTLTLNLRPYRSRIFAAATRR
jgi:SAM-dependent methyltransferase